MSDADAGGRGDRERDDRAGSRSSPPSEEKRAELPTELDLRKKRAPESGVQAVSVDGGIRKATWAPPSEGSVRASSPGLEHSARHYIGFTIDGRYQVEDVVAEGGMGVVYRAKHQVIDKPVAVKILRPDFAKDREVTERFLTEAKAASSIGHAAIVDVFDFGELPDGATYLAMEFVDGTPLAHLLKEGRPLPIDRVLRIGKRIATGLAAAHDAGIVHRDLKPDNLIVIQAGDDPDFVKILDFGIAKVARGQNRLTRAGTIFGTPQYMSPEQGSGGEVDLRTDVYSLGVILYEMTSGKLPFDAENPLGLVTQHMYEKVPLISEMDPPPQDVPPGLEAIILKCLSKKPEQRYGTMVELIADLGKVFEGELPGAVAEMAERGSDAGHERFTRAMKERRASRDRPRWPLYAGGVALVAIAALVFSTRSQGRATAGHQATADSAAAVSTDAAAGTPRQDVRRVAIVVAPIDAHIFRGADDLGTMPVFVPVPDGKTVAVQIRRDGFYPEDVELDGTVRKVIVRLKPIPGVKPAVPVPEAGALESIDLEDLEGEVLAPDASTATAEASVQTGPPVEPQPAEDTPAVPTAGAPAPSGSAAPGGDPPRAPDPAPPVLGPDPPKQPEPAAPAASSS